MVIDKAASARLDRHALVMAIWVSTLLTTAAVLYPGIYGANPWWIAAAFAFVIGAFIGHVIINAVTKSGFTSGEVAFGSVVFAACIVALMLLRWIDASNFGGKTFLYLGAGMLVLLTVVVIYMLIAFGPRAAFARFDVIRDNNLRKASRLPHRGGRR